MTPQHTIYNIFPDSAMLFTNSNASQVIGAAHDSLPHSLINMDATEKYQNTTSSRFITEKRIEPIRFKPQPIIKQQNDWQLLTLTVSFLIIAFVRISGKNFFRNLRLAFVSRPIFKQLFRDGVLFPAGAVIPLLIAYLLVITTLFFQANTAFSFLKMDGESGSMLKIIKPALLLGAYFAIKNIVINVVGRIFKTRSIDKEYLINALFFNTVTTIALIPLLFFSIYAINLTILWFALFVVFFVYLFRIFRGLQIAFEARRYSPYQIFLYLCALEILPVIILFKLLIR